MEDMEDFEYTGEKKKVTPWRVLKWMLFGTSMLVYLVVFIRLFAACDAKISDDIILTAEEKAVFEDMDRDYPLFNYQPPSWTNGEGTVQIKNVYYLEPLSEIQLTVAYRMSKFESDTPFEYSVRVVDAEELPKEEEANKDGKEDEEEEEKKPIYREDLVGEVIEGLEIHSETRFDKNYVRICASGVEIDEGTRRTDRVQTVDADGNVTYGTRTVIEGGNLVYLDMFDSESGELIYSFALAGRGINGVRTRRGSVDVRVID